MTKLDIWERYDSVMEQHAPQTFARFRPPATMEAIAATEKAMGVKFPAELRAAYKRHDGFALFKSFSGNSLAQMVSFWDAKTRCQQSLEMEDLEYFVQQQPTPEWSPFFVRPVNWYERWLPIASDGIVSYCVDLAPGPKGTRAQIIGGSDSLEVIAPSLNAWVTFIVDGFESGRFIEDASVGDCYWIDTKFGDPIASRETFAFYGERGLRY